MSDNINNNEGGNDDNGGMIPASVTDFIFDLFDSVTASQIMDEQHRLYTQEYTDLARKYFSGSGQGQSAPNPWPSPMDIVNECNGSPLFLALYREMTFRHYHNTLSRPNIRERLDGWPVYRELFEEILETANSEEDEESCSFYLLPVWVWDILNEFVYQFQGFCQFRTAVYMGAKKQGYVTVVLFCAVCFC
jgi:translation initiation factor 3 subunit L